MRNALFAGFCVLCLLALVWPGYPLLGNRIHPFVLGFPFSLFWNVLWILLSFAALWTYDRSGRASPTEAGYTRRDR